jgi:tetratricopeptide (TPR) repeat protein
MNRNVANACIIVILVVVTFGRALGNGFVWDDLPVIAENPLYGDAGGILSVLTAEDTIPGLPATGYYRPLTYLSFYLDHLLWGNSPAGFHATNLLLHLGVALTLYRLLASLGGGAVVPLLTTLLFALNPVTTEAVCFLSGGRNTLLCALFALLALVMHRRGMPGRAALCTLAAAASKEVGFLVPLVLVAHDLLLEGKRRSWRKYGLQALPLGLLLAVRGVVTGYGASLSGLQAGTLLLAPELVLRYAAVTLLPLLHQVAYQVAPPHLFSLRFAGALAGCGFLVLLCLGLRRNRLLLFGTIWFLLFLLPALTLATRYKLPMADRHAYLPAIGISLVVAALLAQVPSRRLLAAPALLAGAFCLLTFLTVPVWRSNGSLFERMVHDAPRAETGYTELAAHYLRGGSLVRAEAVIDRGEAAGALTQALARFIRLGMYCREAERLLTAERLPEAQQLVEQVLRLEPDFVPALIDAGSIAARKGDLRGAVALFNRAAALQPADPTPRFNLAETYRLLGEGSAAERELAIYHHLRAGGRSAGAAAGPTENIR